MSQAGIIDVEGSNPSIPTEFDANTGFAVPLANILNIVGTGTVTTTGTGNTITIANSGSVSTSFTADSGTATPAANNLNLFGGSNGIDTVASGSTVTFNFDVTEQPAIPTSITTSSGTCTPSANNFSILGSSGITTSASGTTITIAGGSAVAESFSTDSGTATPSANVISVVGSQGITTSGSGSTVTVTLTNPVTVPRGGTGLSSITAHSLVVGNGTSAMTVLGSATNGQIPIGSTGADPVLATITAGTGISVTNGAGSITIAAAASNAESFVTDSGTATPAANVLTIVGSQGITTSGSGSTVTVTLTNPVTLARGGTSAALTASNGGIFYSNATTGAILSGTATATQMLQSGSSSAPAWSTTTWPATSTINQILYSSAANTVSGLATANRGVLTTGATGVPVITALATDGQVIIGSTAGAPAAATLTAGTGVSITNGSNSITIAAGATVATTYTGNSGTATPSSNNINILGTGGVSTSATGATVTITSAGISGWVTETTTSRSLTANQGVICTSGSLCTCTLPSASVGDEFKIIAAGSGLIKVGQLASQVIHHGSATTTTGTGGSLTATAQWNTIYIICTAANTFTVFDSVGSYTVV